MAPYLKENFGCYNALFLDAGASSAMVYSGKVLSQ
jgi:exopolysaccharide biosynthesis protein